MSIIASDPKGNLSRLPSPKDLRHRVAIYDAGAVPYVNVISSYVEIGRVSVSLHTMRCNEVCSSLINICQYIFEISAVKTYLNIRNLSNIDIKSDCTTGPTNSISLRETPESDLQDASNLTLNFVVMLVSLKTG